MTSCEDLLEGVFNAQRGPDMHLTVPKCSSPWQSIFFGPETHPFSYMGEPEWTPHANQIDCLLIRRRDARHMSNCEVYRGAECEIDDMLLLGTCALRLQKWVKRPAVKHNFSFLAKSIQLFS